MAGRCISTLKRGGARRVALADDPTRAPARPQNARAARPLRDAPQGRPAPACPYHARLAVRCVGIGPLCVDRARYFQLTTAPVGRRCDCARPAYPWEMTCAAGGNPYARRRARRGDHRLRTAAAGCRTPLNPRSRRRPSSRQVDELLDERLSALRPPGIRCVGTFKHKASSALLYVRPGVS